MNEFLTLLQRSMTIEEFKRKFSKLLKFAPFVMLNERKKCRRLKWAFERIYGL